MNFDERTKGVDFFTGRNVIMDYGFPFLPEAIFKVKMLDKNLTLALIIFLYSIYLLYFLFIIQLTKAKKASKGHCTPIACVFSYSFLFYPFLSKLGLTVADFQHRGNSNGPTTAGGAVLWL